MIARPKIMVIEITDVYRVDVRQARICILFGFVWEAMRYRLESYEVD